MKAIFGRDSAGFPPKVILSVDIAVSLLMRLRTSLALSMPPSKSAMISSLVAGAFGDGVRTGSNVSNNTTCESKPFAAAMCHVSMSTAPHLLQELVFDA